jgi:hypothetical protein
MMRPPTEVWQGCSGYWQPAFIRENFLTLGHAAWQGYLIHGRGLVACEVERLDMAITDWNGDVVQYSTQYIPAVAVSTYLKSRHLQTDFSHDLMNAVQLYIPDQDLLIAIEGNGPIEMGWLRNLAIAPPDCYQQVCDRWDEFNLAPPSARRCNDAEQ